jgi:hypothetical protein
MLSRLLVSTALGVLLIQAPAIAQDKSASMKQDLSQPAQSLPQELKQKLTNQGFTDVQVVAGSYIVSAKDKDGDPITAIIGPHSLTVFSVSSADSSQTTGSASGDNSSDK